MTRLIICLFALASVAFSAAGQSAEGRSASVVVIDGTNYYIHTVVKGQTLYMLSRLYSVDQNQILRSNPQAVEGLKEGQVLKIPVVREPEPKLSNRKKNRLFDTHTVRAGETLYAISRQYGISVNTILEDNEGIDPAALSVGTRLDIRKSSKGESTEVEIDRQMENYAEAVNSIEPGYRLHVVEPGETIYGLSMMYDVSQEELIRLNDLTDGLRAGALIKLPPALETGEVPDQALPPVELPNTIRTPEYLSGLRVSGFRTDNPRVAVFLPLQGTDGSPARNYLDFYRGFLIGLEDLKNEGISARVSVYNTSRSLSKVYETVSSPQFEYTEMIFGPVFENLLHPVLEFAEERNVPVISPLAVLETESSPVLFQMAPWPGSKYDKLKYFLEGDKNIVYVTTAYPDAEVDSNIVPLLPEGYSRFTFSSGSTNNLRNVVDTRRENIFVVSCTNEATAELLLATITSFQSNLAARSMSRGSVRVVASPQWGRFSDSIDKSLFFKVQLTYVTSYHADRGNDLVVAFDSRYINSFQDLPSMFSYRGYDAAKLFIGSAVLSGDELKYKLNRSGLELLQMPYNFIQTHSSGVNINDQWGLVKYGTDYKITVD